MSAFVEELLRRLRQTKIGLGLLALTGLGSAHFAGFLGNIKGSLAASVASVFAPRFFFDFSVYLISALIVARVVSYAVVIIGTTFYYPLSRFHSTGRIKRTREHLWAMEGENSISIGLFAIFFLIIFPYSYLGMKGWRLFFWVALIFIITVIGLFSRSWRFISYRRAKFIRRMKVGSKIQSTVLKGMVGVLAGVLVILSYITGSLRYEFLWRYNPTLVQHERFSGYFNVIMVSGDNLLLVQHSGLLHRNVLVGESAIIYENVNIPEGHKGFPPLVPLMPQ